MVPTPAVTSVPVGTKNYGKTSYSLLSPEDPGNVSRVSVYGVLRVEKPSAGGGGSTATEGEKRKSASGTNAEGKKKKV